MYKTAAELLAVGSPDEADALAQNALRLDAKVRELAGRARIQQRLDIEDALVMVHFNVWLPLMAAHGIKDYDFVRAQQDNQPDPEAGDPLDMLPIMIPSEPQEDGPDDAAHLELLSNLPRLNLHSAAAILTDCEAEYEAIAEVMSHVLEDAAAGIAPPRVVH